MALGWFHQIIKPGLGPDFHILLTKGTMPVDAKMGKDSSKYTYEYLGTGLWAIYKVHQNLNHQLQLQPKGKQMKPN